jgi:hypothetical protein
MNPTRRRHELARLAGKIKTLPLELQNLRQSDLETAEVDAEERTHERLHRRLAAVSRRAATLLTRPCLELGRG